MTSDSLHAREVWDGNLDEELALIRSFIEKFPYVAMDTEFPGVVSTQMWCWGLLDSSSITAGSASCWKLQMSGRFSISDTEVRTIRICSIGLLLGIDLLDEHCHLLNNFLPCRCNVDLLKLIQLGLTLTDERGNLPRIGNHFCLWQFNFREFSLKEDMYAQDSIELLKH